RIKVVIPVRNPVEVARSLERRNGFAPAKSYLLWLRHMFDAVADTRDVPRCVVSYDALLRDWRKTVIDISQRLEMTWPRPLSATASQIDEFISTSERHHMVKDEEWLDLREIADWVKRAYRQIMAMTAGDADDSTQVALDALTVDFDTAIDAFAPLMETQKERERRPVEAGTGLKWSVSET